MPHILLIYDKLDTFEIAKFPFLDGGVHLSFSYGVYISQLNSFARVYSIVDGFNNRICSLKGYPLESKNAQKN